MSSKFVACPGLQLLTKFSNSLVGSHELSETFTTSLANLSLGDCNIKDGKLGIQMTMSREGRPSGEAYIEMEGLDDIEIGLKKDKEHMGHRYIEGTAL
jgi:hypothetical protein